MDRLEPQAVDPQAVEVVDGEFAVGIGLGGGLHPFGEVLEVAGLVVARAGGLRRQHVQLVHRLLHRLLRRDDDDVVAAVRPVRVVGVVRPLVRAFGLVAGRDAVDAALAGFEGGGERALPLRHRNGLPVPVGAVAGRDGIAVRRDHAVRPAVVVPVRVGVVAAAEVGEEFDLVGVVRRVVFDHDGDGVVGVGFVDEELAGRVVGRLAVDGEVAGPVGEHAVLEGAGAVAGVVFRLLPVAVALAVAGVDFVDEDRVVVQQPLVGDGAHPHHGLALASAVRDGALHGHGGLAGQGLPGAGRAGLPGLDGLDAGAPGLAFLLDVDAVADDRLVGPGRAVVGQVADLGPDLDGVVGAAGDVATVPDEARLVALGRARDADLERRGFGLGLGGGAHVHRGVVRVHVEVGRGQLFDIVVVNLEVVLEEVPGLTRGDVAGADPEVVGTVVGTAFPVQVGARPLGPGVARAEAVEQLAVVHVKRVAATLLGPLVVADAQVHRPAFLRGDREAHAVVGPRLVVGRAVPADARDAGDGAGDLGFVGVAAIGLDGIAAAVGGFELVDQRLAAGKAGDGVGEIDGVARGGALGEGHVRPFAGGAAGDGLRHERVVHRDGQRADVGAVVGLHRRRDGDAAAVVGLDGVRRDGLELGADAHRRLADGQLVVAAAVVVPDGLAFLGRSDDAVVERAAAGDAFDFRMPPGAGLGGPVGDDGHVRPRPGLGGGPVATDGRIEVVNDLDLVDQVRGTGLGVDVDGVVAGGVLGREAVGAADPHAGTGRAAAAGEDVADAAFVVVVDVDAGVLALEFDIDGAVGGRGHGGAARAVRIEHFEIGVGPTRVNPLVLLVVGGIQHHQRGFVVIPLGESVEAPVAGIGALFEAAAAEGAAVVADVVEPGDVRAEAVLPSPIGELVALGVAGLEAAVEHAFALPVAVIAVGVVPAAVGAVAVAALVEHVFGPVVQQRNRRGQIEEGHGRLHDPLGMAGVVRREGHREAVDVVVVEESDDVFLARPVLLEAVHFLAQLVGAVAVAERVVHGLHEREEEGRVEAVTV